MPVKSNTVSDRAAIYGVRQPTAKKPTTTKKERKMATKLIAQLERKQRDTKPIGPGDGDGDSDGPKRQKVSKPDTQELLKRMRRVDKDQSRRYRQRTGE
jgi:hypothetical protein